jgi:hypothetical protein
LRRARGELVLERRGNVIFEGVEDLGFERGDGSAGGDGGEVSLWVLMRIW